MSPAAIRPSGPAVPEGRFWYVTASPNPTVPSGPSLSVRVVGPRRLRSRRCRWRHALRDAMLAAFRLRAARVPWLPDGGPGVVHPICAGYGPSGHRRDPSRPGRLSDSGVTSHDVQVARPSQSHLGQSVRQGSSKSGETAGEPLIRVDEEAQCSIHRISPSRAACGVPVQ